MSRLPRCPGVAPTRQSGPDAAARRCIKSKLNRYMATTSLTLSGYRNNRATGAAARWSASPLRDDVTFWVDAIGYGCTTDHTTISSRTDSLDRMDAVALAFHEGAQVIVHELQRAFKSCEEQKKDCGDPWHAVQFYTLGELMKGELPKQNIDCTPYQSGRWTKYL